MTLLGGACSVPRLGFEAEECSSILLVSRALLPDSVSYGKQNFIYLKTAKKLLIYTIVAVCMCNKLYLFRKRIVRVIREKNSIFFILSFAVFRLRT